MNTRLLLGAITAAYLVLVLPAVTRHGISWDEQTDLTVATVYATEPGGWLVGSDLDAINVRLPMFTSAVLFALLGHPSLSAARLASVTTGVLTLLAVFAFCSRELDRRKGLLAAALLATSPYFLAYSKVAFTEGDAFVTAALAWLLVCLSRLRRQRSLGWGALTGVALGAALASKISATASIPVVLVTLLWPARDEAEGSRVSPESPASALSFLLVAGYVAIGGGWELGRVAGGGHYDGAGAVFLALHAATVFAVWLAVLAVSARCRTQRLARWPLSAFVLALAGLSFFVLPPVHVTNPDVFRELLGAFFFGTFEAPAAFALEAAAQNLAVVAIKPSPLLGVGALVAVAAAAARVRSRPELRLPLLFTACYFAFLVRLPWAQTFYMMPLFPVLMILLADLGITLFQRARVPAVALAIAATATWASDVWQSHPDYHLNGYQWVGARPFAGRPTLGPRSLVQLPTDGVTQALAWVDEHASPGETVALFVRPQHIVTAVLPDAPYQLVNGLADGRAIERADWVVTTLASEVEPGFGMDDPDSVFAFPYDRARLRGQFAPIFSVERAFGLEVATVWRRRAPAASER